MEERRIEFESQEEKRQYHERNYVDSKKDKFDKPQVSISPRYFELVLQYQISRLLD